MPVMAQNTLPYLDGVPIMSGFALSNDDVIVFDKPQGRVIDLTVWCSANCPSTKEIEVFYMDTMNRLGWNTIKDHEFTNEGATLNYNIMRDKNSDSVIILFQSNG